LDHRTDTSAAKQVCETKSVALGAVGDGKRFDAGDDDVFGFILVRSRDNLDDSVARKSELGNVYKISELVKPFLEGLWR